jgi:hypothetical protein
MKSGQNGIDLLFLLALNGHLAAATFSAALIEPPADGSRSSGAMSLEVSFQAGIPLREVVAVKIIFHAISFEPSGLLLGPKEQENRQ